MKGTNLNFMCPLCTRSMLNSVDIKYNFSNGICKNCFEMYFYDKESQLELEKQKHYQRYSDVLDAQDAFRDFCVRWAKGLKKEQELRVERLSQK